MILRSLSFSLVFIFAAAEASAGRRPTFHQDFSISKATHIVLATEGDVIDGRFSVIESWKGDLEVDTEIILPALAKFRNEQLRTVKWTRGRVVDAPYTRLVTGQEIVIFLVESEEKRQSNPEFSEIAKWSSAYLGDAQNFDVSVAWIEYGEAYTYQQVINPGPSELRHLCTALELEARVANDSNGP